LVKSNTSNPFQAFNLNHVVKSGVISSLPELKKQVKIEHQYIEAAVRQFFDLFAVMALDTTASPPLGQYTPNYTPLSQSYAARKPTGAGFFRKTGTLISDVKSLSGETTNLLGKSSYSIDPKFSGAKKGFSIDSTSPLKVRNAKSGRFSNPVTSLKNFRVEVKHTPFDKVNMGFQPQKLEADIFKGAYDDIYNKLTNQQGPNTHAPYRSAFYSFMSWWLKEHLPEVIK